MNPLTLPVVKLFTKFFSTFTLGYALVSFELLHFRKYIKVSG